MKWTDNIKSEWSQKNSTVYATCQINFGTSKNPGLPEDPQLPSSSGIFYVVALVVFLGTVNSLLVDTMKYAQCENNSSYIMHQNNIKCGGYLYYSQRCNGSFRTVFSNQLIQRVCIALVDLTRALKVGFMAFMTGSGKLCLWLYWSPLFWAFLYGHHSPHKLCWSLLSVQVDCPYSIKITHPHCD